MKISFACTGCGKTLNAPDELAGKRVRCPNCRTVLAIPRRPSGSQSAPPAASGRPGPPASSAVSKASARSAPPQERLDYDLQETPSPEPALQTPRIVPLAASPDAVAAHPTPAGSGWSPPSYSYWLFALAFLPLVWSLLGGESDDIERFLRTLERVPQIEDRAEKLAEEEEDFTRQELLELLPDGRIEGAHLGVATWMHWGYAVLSGVGFLGLILAVFQKGRAVPLHLLWVALGTATVGVLSLVLFQWIAAITQGIVLYGRNVVVLVFFYAVKFIGFSYSAASDPNTNFWLGFLGFTCGVGLCEEFTKAMPVVFHYRGTSNLGWRGACVWGLASGIGFGVAEGIIYSSDYYNGISTGGIYVVRFVSCVALHAVWSAAVAITIHNNQDLFAGDWEWWDSAVSWLKVLGVPMVLHGLYDTLLKREMNGLALLTAAASFLWMVLLIEWARRMESDGERARALAGA